MKKLLAILIFLVPFFSFAQVTHHFPHQDATWGQFHGSSLFGTTGSTFFHTATGDTTVNGIEYTKIFSIDSIWFWQNHLEGLIREDSLGNVYSKYFDNGSDTIEHLLYKFNVLAGDTVFDIFNNMGSIIDFIVIDSVTQILDNYGVLRKAIYVAPHNENGCGMFDPLIWIEGIGSNAGLFTPKGNWIPDALGWLTCFTENDSVKLAECLVCNLWLGNNAFELNSSLGIYPNPSSGKFTLSIPQSFSFPITVSASNIFGKHVLLLKENSLHQFSCDISNFSEGNYFITIQSETEISTLKIMLIK